MRKAGLAAALVLPIVIAACNRTPEPEPMVMPTMSGPEQACADRAAQMAGVEAGSVSVVPTASTKTGATIYTVNAGGVEYMCVVEMDMTVSQFSMM